MYCEPNKFSWRLMWWAVASAALTVAVAFLQRGGVIPPAWRGAVALVPVVPMVGFFHGMRRYLRSIDEMQRLMHLEALFFQFGVTAILVMAYAALAKAGVLPSLTAASMASYVWTGMFLLWGVGVLVVRRKYQ